MSDSSSTIIETLSAHAWRQLGEAGFPSLHLDDIAEQAGIDPVTAQLVATDVTSLILHALRRHDLDALQTSQADFADDPEASIYEKLLEGLIMRFETLQESKPQIRNLHQAATRNPLLALQLSHQLGETVGKYLSLAGDDSTGPLKQARILGVIGVLLRVRSTWLDDDSADMGLTIKALDEELKKACEWAVTFRILSPSDMTQQAPND